MTRLEWGTLSLILLLVGCWLGDKFTGPFPAALNVWLPGIGGAILGQKVLGPLWRRSK